MTSIINATILDKINDYFKIIENTIWSCRIKGFKGDVVIEQKSIPESWPDDIYAYDFKDLKLKSVYGLVDTYLTQYGEKVTNEHIKDNVVFDYLQISFGTKPDADCDYLNIQPQTFMIFKFYENGKVDDFRLLYNSFAMNKMILNFMESQRIDLHDVRNEYEATSIQYLEKLIFGICQQMDIEIPASIQIPKPEKSTVSKFKSQDFSKLLKLITRELYNDADYTKDGKQLLACHKEGGEEFLMNEEARNVLERYEKTYYSDWKFDPEDVEYGISQILDTDFTFTYPPETYAHNLFPYIQTELAKQNLELMNIDTFGDSYLFFVANKNEVDTILELSQVVEIKINKL